jgi:S-adenosylmethionine decarboxylase
VIGRHLIADFYGIKLERLNDVDLLSDCLQSAARRCGLTPLAPPVVHHFDGGGVTGFILLAESHIALHTYPELGFIALDIFSCGNSDPDAALEIFRDALSPQREQVTTIVRGGDVA